MEERSKLRSLILKSAYAVVIVLIIAVVALLILKYDVEGEKNMKEYKMKMMSINGMRKYIKIMIYI